MKRTKIQAIMQHAYSSEAPPTVLGRDPGIENSLWMPSVMSAETRAEAMTRPSPRPVPSRSTGAHRPREMSQQIKLLCPHPQFGDNVLNRRVVLEGLLNVKDEAAAAGGAQRQFCAVVTTPRIVGIYKPTTPKAASS
jgi:hypothetical protein